VSPAHVAPAEEVRYVRLRGLFVYQSILTCGLLVLACAAVPSVAEAQIAPGVRGGGSVDPDQVYIGGHIETEPLVERLVFRPNVEIGFGDDVTLVAFNFEFLWKFPEFRAPWQFYAGGGPAINLYQFEGPGDETEAGFNFVGGFEHRGGLFFEFKVGVPESPDFKVAVGYTFR
jgi:hypothetical protein